MKLTNLTPVTLEVSQVHSYTMPSRLSIEGNHTPNLIALALAILRYPAETDYIDIHLENDKVDPCDLESRSRSLIYSPI